MLQPSEWIKFVTNVRKTKFPQQMPRGPIPWMMSSKQLKHKFSRKDMTCHSYASFDSQSVTPVLGPQMNAKLENAVVCILWAHSTAANVLVALFEEHGPVLNAEV